MKHLNEIIKQYFGRIRRCYLDFYLISKHICAGVRF